MASNLSGAEQLHSKIGYFNPTLKIAGDYDFFIRVAHKFGAVHFRETLGLFLQRSDSLSGATNSCKTANEILQVLKIYRNQIPINHIYPLLKDYKNVPEGIAAALWDFGNLCALSPYKDFEKAISSYKEAIAVKNLPHNTKNKLNTMFNNNAGIILFCTGDKVKGKNLLKLANSIPEGKSNLKLAEKLEKLDKKGHPINFIISELSHPVINNARQTYGLMLDEGLNLIESEKHEQLFWDVYKGPNGIAISEEEKERTLKRKPRVKKVYINHQDEKKKTPELFNIPEIKNKKNFRILYTMFGWQEEGGGTILPKTMAWRLKENGNKVGVFFAASRHPEKNTPYYLEKSEDKGVSLYGLYNRPTVFSDEGEPLREIEDKNTAKIFSKIIDEFQPDIIHFHNFLGLSFALAEEAKKRNIPSLYTPHNHHMIDPLLYMLKPNLEIWKSTDFFKNSRLTKKYPEKENAYRERIKAARRLINNKIDFTLAISTRSRELLIDFGGRPDRIAVVHQVPQSVEKLIENPPVQSHIHSPVRIGFIGNILPHKGVHKIVSAAQFFSHGEVEFLLYGSGNENYIKELKKIDKKGIIQWKGQYAGKDLPKIAENLDAIIISSILEEGAGLVIIESFAMKLPVIGARIGGIPDFIEDDINGKLYPYNSEQNLASIIKELIYNPKKLKKLQKNCSLPYTFNEFINHIEWIYEKLINKEKITQKEISLFFKSNLKETSSKKEIIESPALNRVKLSEDVRGGYSNKVAEGKMSHPLPSPMYLNLGCGRDIREGFINIDLFSEDPRVVGMDIRKLSLPDNCADVILASDILEHFSHRETGAVLSEWARVLKPGGEMIVRCPSLYLQVKAYWKGIWDADVASFMIFGGQSNPGDYHCIGFDKKSIKKHLENAGLKVTSFEEVDTPQDKRFINLNMTVRARKMAVKEIEEVEKKDEKFSIKWEGSQFVYHSLALINRELTLQLIDKGHEVSVIPYEKHKFGPEEDKRFQKIQERLNRKLSRPAEVHIRHQWPPNFNPPPEGQWVIIQPWEYGAVRKDWVKPMRDKIDEIWVPSNYVRQCYIESGIQPEKIFVIPNGFNPHIFNPNAPSIKVETEKKFKFLFVGGTIWRKGPDILLDVYKKNFTSKDDVVLVIKDMGQDSFYKGQGLGEKIKEIQKNPDMPEILYITEFLTEREIAGLYTACDCLVHPYRGEGFGFPVLEAMACGRPVIVTKGGATDDFCKESFVYHIDAKWQKVKFPDIDLVGDVATVLEPAPLSLAGKMKEVYSNYSEAAEKADKALKFVKENYTWEKIGREVTKRISILSKKPVSGKRNREELLIEGEKLYSEGNKSQAIKCFKEILAENPEFTRAHSNLAAIYWQNKERHKAVYHIEKAIKLEPYNKDVVWNYGLIMQETRRKEEALLSYKKFLDKNPEDMEISRLAEDLEKELEIQRARKINKKEKKKKGKKKKKK